MQDDGRPAPVRLSGRLICGSREEAVLIERHLPEHVRLTRSEPGCLSFDVTTSDDPMIWVVEERFVDRLAFEAHQDRTKASLWGRATAAIRREYDISTEPQSIIRSERIV